MYSTWAFLYQADVNGCPSRSGQHVSEPSQHADKCENRVPHQNNSHAVLRRVHLHIFFNWPWEPKYKKSGFSLIYTLKKKIHKIYTLHTHTCPTKMPVSVAGVGGEGPTRSHRPCAWIWRSRCVWSPPPLPHRVLGFGAPAAFGTTTHPSLSACA